MRIALFKVRNFLACHYALFGYREALERMGHEVIECDFPGNAVQGVPAVAARMPSIARLLECDLILSGYHEYTQPWLKAVYPDFNLWKQLMAKVPVIARFDESMDRGDLQLPARVPELKSWATHYFWPAAQDAEKFGGEWLPYGADTSIFNPYGARAPEQRATKKYPVAFIGSLYQDRREYLMKLSHHIGNTTGFFVGNVRVEDLTGLHERDTTERLAENYRQIHIFFCLPPMSNLIVEKVFDIMACDTMVMYPRKEELKKNLSIFADERHIVYYDYGFYANNGKQLRFYLDHPDEVHRIAHCGGEQVRSNHNLEGMLRKMLDVKLSKGSLETVSQTTAV